MSSNHESEELPMIFSRADLIQYCLRKLGHPVMMVNVDPSQIDDRIDDSIQRFWEYHGQGSERVYLGYLIKEADITNRWIPMSEKIISVLRVLPFGSQYFHSMEYQMFITDLLQFRSSAERGVGDWTVIQSYISLLQQTFDAEKVCSFNSVRGQLHILLDWTQLVPGQLIIIECYALVDPESNLAFYNSPWLKAYATAQIKQQWGINMSKYQNFQLPSGITLNGRQYYDDSVQEIAQLESELVKNYQLPVDFMMG